MSLAILTALGLDVDALVETVLGLLIPRSSPQVLAIVGDVVSSIVDVVTVVIAEHPMDPEEIIELVTQAVDDGLDAVPGWGDLPEIERDKVLDGLSIVAILIAAAIPQTPPKRARKWGTKRVRVSRRLVDQLNA